MELSHEHGAAPDLAHDGPDSVRPEVGSESPRDTWCTPEIIVRALLRLWPNGADLDPCSNARSIVPARMRWELEDGVLPLASNWASYFRVYCNCPYSSAHPWVAAMRGHGLSTGEVVGCLRSDPSVAWFADVWSADRILFPDFRVQFEPPPGVKVSGNTGPNALPYWGPEPDRFAWAFRELGKVVTP
jgi:hypothetical protein